MLRRRRQRPHGALRLVGRDVARLLRAAPLRLALLPFPLRLLTVLVLRADVVDDLRVAPALDVVDGGRRGARGRRGDEEREAALAFFRVLERPGHGGALRRVRVGDVAERGFQIERDALFQIAVPRPELEELALVQVAVAVGVQDRERRVHLIGRERGLPILPAKRHVLRRDAPALGPAHEPRPLPRVELEEELEVLPPRAVHHHPAEGPAVLDEGEGRLVDDVDAVRGAVGPPPVREGVGVHGDLDVAHPLVVEQELPGHAPVRRVVRRARALLDEPEALRAHAVHELLLRGLLRLGDHDGLAAHAGASGFFNALQDGRVLRPHKFAAKTWSSDLAAPLAP